MSDRRACWGAFEEPRQCKLCGSILARCECRRELPGGRIHRKRVCVECGRKFDTFEPVTPPPVSTARQ